MTCLEFIIYNYFEYLQTLLKYLAKKTIHQWCNGPFSNLQSRHGPYWVHPGWLWIFINQFHEIFREIDLTKNFVKLISGNDTIIIDSYPYIKLGRSQGRGPNFLVLLHFYVGISGGTRSPDPTLSAKGGLYSPPHI